MVLGRARSVFYAAKFKKVQNTGDLTKTYWKWDDFKGPNCKEKILEILYMCLGKKYHFFRIDQLKKKLQKWPKKLQKTSSCCQWVGQTNSYLMLATNHLKLGEWNLCVNLLNLCHDKHQIVSRVLEKFRKKFFGGQSLSRLRVANLIFWD